MGLILLTLYCSFSSYPRFAAGANAFPLGGGGGEVSGFENGPNSTFGSGLRPAVFDLAKLPKFEKNFYNEDPLVTARSEAEVMAFRKTAAITVFGKNVPKPIETFEESSFPRKILTFS